MGRFSNGLVIKKADFVNVFTELMKKRRYLPCDESAAELSYFVEQGGEWAALAGADYTENPSHSESDLALIVKELKVPAFSVEVVDSDFAILNLNGSEVIVGDSSGYGIEEAPSADRAVWEPLITNGTFEDLMDFWENEEVFVEDVLCSSAPLFGIEPPTLIVPDYRDFSEDSDNKNVTALYFKKTEHSVAASQVARGVRKTTFNGVVAGKFAYGLNIKSNDFANAFIELMKKRDFVPCGEDTAEILYIVEQCGDWAALSGKDFIDTPDIDMKFIAKELNAPVFSVEVIEDDFAILRMDESEVILGNSKAYGIKDAPSADRADWESLLSNGTFEELVDIWENGEFSVKDALCKSASLFGIEPPKIIVPEYRDYSKCSDNKNVAVLYFRKVLKIGS